ncbi:Cell division protein FtsK [Candidatus Nitrotoga sp. HW29]|uniref:ATP-binding protein n=1 Tax=Candidatus Nitrotoga sp. HW29 TaxID=2886963 RepID=UPI001EF1666C|nr:ATP-binding protein [Candidatus Nitrotoga sp. HW29]CAH1905364.1 Cell division protein FtsK [Candidatus Nitrotoga sp. HW29]
MSATSRIEDAFPRGLLRPELFIGVLSSVSAQAVRFNLNEAGSPSGAHFLGGRYGKGEVGEFVLIEGQINLLLGRVVEIHLPEPERRSVNASHSKVPDLDAAGTIQLLGSVAMDSLRVTAGVESYPRLGDRVYAAPHNFVANLPSLMESEGSPESKVLLKLGSIDVALESAVSIRPEKLFGRHCAILGATGGGKSWTTARIIEECIKYKTKIILLDATGEYRGFSGEHVEHFHLGNPVETAIGSQPRSLPPTCFVESDFIALFEPAGKVQGPKMRAAMRSLRLAQLVPTVASNGIIKKIDQSKGTVIAAEQQAGVSGNLDDPRQEFDVSKLIAQIEQECVYPDGFGVGKGVKDTTKWGGDSGEVSYCLSLMSRISAVLTSSSFECVFKSTDPALTAAIADFVSNDKRLLRICLSGVAYEFKAREITANVIGRHLLNLARNGAFKNSPVVVIVDEAHNFLGRQVGGEDAVARLDAFELIAKEGRKYGLNICLTTQRPRDITEGVLSQMGTLVVHRLTNDRDREVVERACGEIDRSASSFLPNLKPGEAAIIGADFPIPLTIQIFPPNARPKSDGPDYQKHWQLDPPTP